MHYLPLDAVSCALSTPMHGCGGNDNARAHRSRFQTLARSGGCSGSLRCRKPRRSPACRSNSWKRHHSDKIIDMIAPRRLWRSGLRDALMLQQRQTTIRGNVEQAGAPEKQPERQCFSSRYQSPRGHRQWRAHLRPVRRHPRRPATLHFPAAPSRRRPRPDQGGVDPATPIATRHAGAGFDAMTSTVGAAAKWTVRENEIQSPTFVRWEAFPASRVRRPCVKTSGRYLTPCLMPNASTMPIGARHDEAVLPLSSAITGIPGGGPAVAAQGAHLRCGQAR